MPSSLENPQPRIERLVREFPGLVSELHLEAVLDRVAHLAAELLGARYAAVGMLGPDRQSLESFTVAGLTEEEQHRIGDRPIGRGILGLLIREGRPIRLTDLVNVQWTEPGFSGVDVPSQGITLMLAVNQQL